MAMEQEKINAAFWKKLDRYIKANYKPEEKKKAVLSTTDASLGAGFGIIAALNLSLPSMEALRHRKEQTFAERLLSLMNEKDLTPQEVYKKAGLTKALFSKIKKDVDYRPSKDTVICFIFALHLEESEANDLMQRAGYSFSHSIIRDLIIQFFIQQGVLDIDALEGALYDRHLKTLHEQVK